MIRAARRLAFPALLLILTAFSTTARAQDSQGSSALTIDQARQILDRGTPSATLGAITLEGLNYSREIGLGQGLRVIVLSKNTGGGLLLFSPSGVLQNSIATGEITWIQLFDLNDDGISEVVTEEVEGRGTGILVKNFKLYTVADGRIEQIWKHLSYRRESSWNPASPQQNVNEMQCFLRFDAAGGGSASRMTYLEPLKNGAQFRKSEYVMSGSTIRELPEVATH